MTSNYFLGGFYHSLVTHVAELFIQSLHRPPCGVLGLVAFREKGLLAFIQIHLPPLLFPRFPLVPFPHVLRCISFLLTCQG